MELHEAPEIFQRIVHTNEEKQVQIRLVVSTFRGVEYISLRKYYLDFEGEWSPTKEGVSFPISIENTRELFIGLTEILSLAESKAIIEEEFKEVLSNLYLK